MKLLSLVLISYILGSIPFCFLLGYFCGGIDLRNVGSKNVGATNLFRNCGFKYAFFGFLFDFLKGYFALYVASEVFKSNIEFTLLSAIFVILGHVFPVFLKFKGGKGVSTSAGVLFFLSRPLFFIVFIFFWLVYFLTEIVSLASISSAILLVLASIFMFYLNKISLLVMFFCVLMGVLIVIFHRKNLKNLLKNREQKTK